MKKGDRVIFTNGHPHEGEIGVFQGEECLICGRMGRFSIINCKHGTQECFAKPEKYQRL
jgi:hypothetical protein